MIKRIAIILMGFVINFCSAQQDTFKIELEEDFWPTAPALHSFAIGEWSNNWYIVGGRTNGLHGFLSPLAFPSDGKHNDITVINPYQKQSFTISMDGLDANVREALTSSNMPFYQKDSLLFMIGGYGWSDVVNDFITFPTLTVVNLACLANTNNATADCITQIQDERMAICGAHLQMIQDTFYLVFGHRFDGVYNRNPNNNFFVQTYSNEIRRFQINFQNQIPEIVNYAVTHDSINFHRRDYNLVPQIFPDRSEGFTAFSGVFQYSSNIPYLNSVDIKSNTFQVNDEFNQHLSQYHSAVLPVYDSLNNFMHNYFFGGMSQFFIDTITQAMVEDTLVPFVNTISHVKRDSEGNLFEAQLNFSMNGLEGTNAEFIPLPSTKTFMHKIVDLNHLLGRTQVGWIYGGIISPEINISETDPAMSYASNKLYKVYIDKTIDDPVKSYEAIQSIRYLKLFPNPGTSQNRTLTFELIRDEQLNIAIFDKYGRIIKQLSNKSYPAGKHQLDLELDNLNKGAYLMRIQSNSSRKTISFIII